MTVQRSIEARGISEILHFTTNKGILGILDSKSLKARARLQKDERLEYIFQPNAVNRDKDIAWLDYVNLSISRINNQFFSASDNWHKDKNIWWCILSFSPEILSHEGVHFTTTNNIYTGVRRGGGGNGLESLFAHKVIRWTGKVVERDSFMPDNHTTCIQAEVLYPGAVSTEFLRRIYVRDEQSADELAGQLHVLQHPPVDIDIAPKLFP